LAPIEPLRGCTRLIVRQGTTEIITDFRILFRPKDQVETILRMMKPLFMAGEDIAKPGSVINPPNKTGRQNKRTGSNYRGPS
jgi:hypothetical protein